MVGRMGSRQWHAGTRLTVGDLEQTEGSTGL